MSEREMHGMTGTPEHMAWKEMKARCYRKSKPGYECYGGRGIGVCREWRSSFTAFFEYMGPRPGKGYSLDRINSDLGYEPGNVRWADQTTQNRNFSDRKSPLGVRGVRLLRGRYYANIHVNRRQIALGGFDNFFDAVCARKSAELSLWEKSKGIS